MIEFGNYALGSDRHSWIIYERRTSRKHGRIRWVAVAWYFHLDDALRGLMNDMLKGQDHTGVNSLLDAITACSRQFRAVARGIRPRTANAA